MILLIKQSRESNKINFFKLRKELKTPPVKKGLEYKISEQEGRIRNWLNNQSRKDCLK